LTSSSNCTDNITAKKIPKVMNDVPSGSNNDTSQTFMDKILTITHRRNKPSASELTTYFRGEIQHAAEKDEIGVIMQAHDICNNPVVQEAIVNIKNDGFNVESRDYFGLLCCIVDASWADAYNKKYRT
jgi:predicted amino acid-binding ACT domain protein